MLKRECTYADQIVESVEPKADVCETCGIEGPLWLCATCGYVGYCESKNSHDTDYWQEADYAIIQRMPINDDSFTYCYEDKNYLK